MNWRAIICRQRIFFNCNFLNIILDLTHFTIRNWLDVFQKRYIEETLFINETKRALNSRRPKITKETRQDQDEDYDVCDEEKPNIAALQNRVRAKEPKLHELFKDTMRFDSGVINFKPEEHPWFTLLTSNNINDIKRAIMKAHYGLLLLPGRNRSLLHLIYYYLFIFRRKSKGMAENARDARYSPIKVYQITPGT